MRHSPHDLHSCYSDREVSPKSIETEACAIDIGIAPDGCGAGSPFLPSCPLPAVIYTFSNKIKFVCSVVCVFVCLFFRHIVFLFVLYFYSIEEEIKSRLKLGNACYYSVQNLLSSRLLSKNLKTKIYRTIILPVVLYGCEAWSLTAREERKLMVFENMVLRRIFGPGMR